MAHVVRFFMGPEDESGFLRDLAPLDLELYPRIVPPDWEARPVDGGLAGTLEDPGYYLGIPAAGPITVDKIKRGPNRGMLTILEVFSPVIFFERSLLESNGEVLRSGQLWAELQVSGDVQRRVQKAPVVEQVFKKISDLVTRHARRSQPTGYFLLPHACRLFKEGIELRETGRKGGLIRPYNDKR